MTYLCKVGSSSELIVEADSPKDCLMHLIRRFELHVHCRVSIELMPVEHAERCGRKV